MASDSATQQWWGKLGFKEQRALLEHSHGEPLPAWLAEAVEAAGRDAGDDARRLTPEEWKFVEAQSGHGGHHDHDHGREGHHSSGGGGF